MRIQDRQLALLAKCATAQRSRAAERGAEALRPYGVESDPFDAVINLLCDVRHYCADSAIGFDAQLRTAEEQFRANWKW